jgi:hypothetical protein
MSAYVIVKVLGGAPTGPLSWEPRAVFAEVARIYSAVAAQSRAPKAIP